MLKIEKCPGCGCTSFIPERHEDGPVIGNFRLAMELATCMGCGSTFLLGGDAEEVDPADAWKQ